MHIERPNPGARFRALTADFPSQGEPIDLEWLHEWTKTGLDTGEHAQVERRLRALLDVPAPPFARAVRLRLFATVLWRRRKLPVAVAMFRRGLVAILETAPSAPVRIKPKTAYTAEQALPLLWQALAALSRGGVAAFAIAGTLLGLEREGRLLAHDKDIDIGAPLSQLQAADALLRAAGWRRNDPGHRFVNFYSYADPASGIELDLQGFLPATAPGKWLGGFWIEDIPWEWQRVTSFPAPGALRQDESPAGPVLALPDPDAWLTALYDDWRTPDTGFDTVISARNLLGFSLLTQCYAYSRILIRCLSGETPRALNLTRQVLQRHTPDDTLLRRIERHLSSMPSHA